MKPGFIFIVIFIEYVTGTQSERVTLIGSHLLSSDSSYKSYLMTNNLAAGSNVDVSLLASGSPTTKNFRNPDADSFDEVDFGRPRQSDNYELKIASSSRNTCKQQSLKLLKSQDRPVIFVQFNKPSYKIGDDFKFRIFVLNQKMVPSSDNQPISVSIVDSNGQNIKKFDNVQISNFGIYENSVKIPDSENLGKWKIQVSSTDRKVTKTFNVEQPSDENLEVHIDMSTMVSYLDRKAFMNIYVKDNENKFFTGIARITVTGRKKGTNRIEFTKNMKNVELTGSKTGVGIGYDDDLGISPTTDLNLNFDVEVIDPATQRSVKTSKEVEFKHNSRNTIHLIKKKYFKPGFKYPMKVKVKTLDGAADNSFNKLSMSVEYQNKNNRVNKQDIQLNLKNGEIGAPLNPAADTAQITVNLEFAGATLTEVIKPLPTMGADEYMQVIVTSKSTSIGDKIRYKAQTTGEMESLHVLIIGLNGIVHYEEFSDAAGKDIYDFDVQLTEEMKPESRGIAFYVRPSDGVIVYDEFVISLGFGIENLLEISAPDTGKPSEQLNLDVKTSKGAKVFLTASDQVSPLLIRDNEISRTDIYNELIYYLNFRFPNTSLYSFEKFNGFILQPLTEGQNCARDSARYTSYDSNDDVEPSSDAKYFPDIWFDESFIATSDSVKSVSVKLPSSLTTWRYYGISVHPTKGFTVAKVQPKTAVKADIAVQVKTPSSAFNSEIVWIDVNVFNSLQDDLRSTVFIELENGVFVDLSSKTEFNIKCYKYIPTNVKDEQFKLDLPASKKSATTSFSIKSKGKGDLGIKVRAVAGNYNDEETKSIKIEQTSEPVDTNNNFDTKVNIEELQNDQVKILLDVKVLRKDIGPTTTVAIEMELPRGYKYISHEQNDKIQNVYVQKDPNVVIFYVGRLGQNQIFRQVVRAVKVYNYDYHQTSFVNVYDLNRQNIKDVVHYKYDKNIEACDRIEVVRMINKAKEAKDITQEAQRSVQESIDKVGKAHQDVMNAQRKLKQAEENAKDAQEKALDADKKSQDAFETAEDAWRVAEQARRLPPPKTFVVQQPNLPTEEATDDPPRNLAEAQRIAKEAQRKADLAQEEAAEAEDNVTVAEDDVNAAKSDVNKAIEDLKKAQLEAKAAREDAERINKAAKEAKLVVAESQNKIKDAQRNVEKSRKVAQDALGKVNELKQEVDNARAVADGVLAKANKARNYKEVEQAVLNVQQRSLSAQKSGQNAQREANVVAQEVDQPLRNAEQQTRNIEELQNTYKILQNNAKIAGAKATTIYGIINAGKANIERVQKLVEDSMKRHEVAKANVIVIRIKANRATEYALAKNKVAQELSQRENQPTVQVSTARPGPYRPQTTARTMMPWTSPRTITQRYPTYIQENTGYQPPRNDYNPAPESGTIYCSKWYRFCTFGF